MKNIAFTLFFLLGCKSPAYYYNYGGMKTVSELQKEAAAFYGKETPAQKHKRNKNRIICINLAELSENRAKGGQKVNMVFGDCMKERGSPLIRWKK